VITFAAPQIPVSRSISLSALTAAVSQPLRFAQGVAATGRGHDPAAAYYSLLTAWRLDAPLERVRDELVHPERWHEWWPGVKAVEQFAAGPTGVGAAFANCWRSVLPFTVTFTTMVIAVREPHPVDLVSSGDLEGKRRLAAVRGRRHRRDIRVGTCAPRRPG